jgi:hypothetical protein
MQPPSIPSSGPTLAEIITASVLPLLDSAIRLIMVLAFLAFIWGMIRFLYTAGDDTSRAEGKKFMVWGTLALLFMVTIWGIVKIIKTTFFG